MTLTLSSHARLTCKTTLNLFKRRVKVGLWVIYYGSYLTVPSVGSVGSCQVRFFFRLGRFFGFRSGFFRVGSSFGSNITVHTRPVNYYG